MNWKDSPGLLGSAGRLPDEGLPFQTIFSNWNHALSTYHPSRRGRGKNAEPVRSYSPRKLSRHAGQRPQPIPITGSPRGQIAKDPEAIIDFDAIQESLDGIVAVNIDALGRTGSSLDALAVALLHSLGDWHVKDALEQAQLPLPSESPRQEQASEEARAAT